MIVAASAGASPVDLSAQLQPEEPGVSVPPIEDVRPIVRPTIEQKLAGNLTVLPVIHGTALLSDIDELRSFYVARNWQHAWFHDNRPTAAVSAFLGTLEKAEEEGLSSRDYHDMEIKDLLTTLNDLNGTEEAAMLRVELDILLTDAYRAYASHLYGGKIEPGRLSSQWPVQKKPGPVISELKEIPPAEQMEKTLFSLPPPYLGYRQLRDLLAKYRRIEAGGGWPVIPKGNLAPGKRDPHVALLRQRLFLTGELKEMSVKDLDFYDRSLEKAVRLFQRAHNQKIDGVVGPATLRLLNMTVTERIDQLRLNMERWRWMPRDMNRYIFVNIPAFELKVAERGFVVLKMRTIVGTEDKPTPSFRGHLNQIELNPFWNIPRSITEKEIIPIVKRDPSYLTRQGIRIYRDWRPNAQEVPPQTINWKEVTPKKFPYRLVQDPGPLNPLGRIKFLFPNHFNVYMHDTPSRHLFGREGRTFSHGCIRLEKPVELARYLLKNELGWDGNQILKKIGTGEHQVITLRSPIPVHIVYFTVWTGPDGLAYFRDDLYEYDHLLDTAMHKNVGKTGGFLF
ncbi:MAG: L,D-transpeptidase family protein [Deltaproteobacteria bacterium]|nr:L,D-transpeptidase family protein [Deltaproteobacteria bacterium]